MRAETRLEQVRLPFDDPRARSSPPASPPFASPAPRPNLAPVLTRHPRARQYVLRVRSDGAVTVTMPRWGSKREALAFAESQQAWIEKQWARLERASQTPRVPMLPAAQVRLWRARAATDLPARLLELAALHGLAPARVSVRDQRWRWGSCSPTGHISLNWRLMLVPVWVRDYVLIHELMHLRRLDHSPKFWALVAAACPGYRDARAWLRSQEDLFVR
jgi:predicted metal-dependent hydrolase